MKSTTTRIFISKVGINNNSPRILKRYFHSTKSLRYDYITEMLNIVKLEDIQFIISQAVIHLQMQDFSDPSVTKAVNYLLRYTVLNETYADFWRFDASLLEGNRIESEDALKEFKILETRMKNNLDNTKLYDELVQSTKRKSITKEAAMLILKNKYKIVFENK